MLPEGSRFQSHLAGGDQEWREWLGWDAGRALDANLWDLIAQVNTQKGKKAPTYPFRPGEKKPAQGTPFMSMIPHRKG